MSSENRINNIKSHLMASKLEQDNVASSNAQPKSTISSHVLDTTSGRPAAGMKITLHIQSSQGAETWKQVSAHITDNDGRVKNFPPLYEAGTYRVIFHTAEYFQKMGITKYFYPSVTVDFIVELGNHYHVPLLISPFGYSTYRGS
jgi:5-hydroxyisourate hydrolase